MNFGIQTIAVFLAALLTTFTASGQSTTILNGSYVTKYGQFRNFIVNPDAQVNAASVTVTNATATRSTTTPVSENGTTEFNVTITSANGTVDFLSTGATQAMLGGRQCAVGFVGRGFQATSTLQAFDGTNVLATYVFGALANTTSVELPFPCPSDPSTIRARITDTSTLAGTNEVGGVYFGRSRNIFDAGNITAWTAYTATVSNATPTTISMQYRRVGDSMEIKPVTQSSALTPTSGVAPVIFSLPSGFSADSNKINVIPGSYPSPDSIVGDGVFYNNSGSFNDAASQTKATFSMQSATTIHIGYQPNSSASGHGFLGWRSDQDPFGSSGTARRFNISQPLVIPIANWPAASSAVSPAQSQDEYVYNTDTTNANNTSSFATGAVGVLFPNRAVGTAVSKRVQFSAAPTALEEVVFQWKRLSTDPGWFEHGNLFSAFRLNNSEYGIIVSRVTDTTYDVTFRTNGFNSGATYATDGIAWSDFFTAGYYWRVVKRSKSNGPVFITSPVRATGTGVAPIAGEVGEKLVFTSRANSGTSGSVTSNGSPLTTLTSGCWEIRGYSSFSGQTAANAVIYGIYTNSAADFTGRITSGSSVFTQNASASEPFSLQIPITDFCVTTSTPIYMKGFAEDANAPITITGEAVRKGDR